MPQATTCVACLVDGAIHVILVLADRSFLMYASLWPLLCVCVFFYKNSSGLCKNQKRAFLQPLYKLGGKANVYTAKPLDAALKQEIDDEDVVLHFSTVRQPFLPLASQCALLRPLLAMRCTRKSRANSLPSLAKAPRNPPARRRSKRVVWAACLAVSSY